MERTRNRFGVAIFTAVALGAGAGAVEGAGVVAGYADGALAGVFIALGIAAIALVAVPSYRPLQTQPVGLR